MFELQGKPQATVNLTFSQNIVCYPIPGVPLLVVVPIRIIRREERGRSLFDAHRFDRT